MDFSKPKGKFEKFCHNFVRTLVKSYILQKVIKMHGFTLCLYELCVVLVVSLSRFIN